MPRKVPVAHLHVLGPSHHALLLLCLHVWQHLLDPHVSCTTGRIPQRVRVLLGSLLLLQHGLLLLLLFLLLLKLLLLLQLLLNQRVPARESHLLAMHAHGLVRVSADRNLLWLLLCHLLLMLLLLLLLLQLLLL